MHLLHRFLSSWFGFNKQQRNGVIVLCFLIILLFILRISFSHFIKPEPILIADFSGVNLPESKSPFPIFSDDSIKHDEVALFVFDPNTVSKEELVKLGFKPKTANTFINYRNKGAQFRKKEDVKKVYGISDELYAKIEPYILIETKEKQLETKNDIEEKKFNKKEIPIIELNSIDSLGLLPLPGIGGGYAKRILKYRSLLGGYNKIEQLKEVYGFTDTLYNLIKPYIKVNATLVSKIDLNTEDFKALNKHPYISYEETKAIFNYRRNNGPIKTIEQLKEVLSVETIEKIKPYLEI